METDSLKWLVSWLATVSTIGLFLSGLSVCRKVWKQGDTRDIAVASFIVTATNCAFWLKYGLLKFDSTLIVVNTVGLFLEIGYLAFYYFFTGLGSRRLLNKTILASFAAFAFVYGASVYGAESPVLALGYVGSLTAMGVYASPLSAVAQVLRHRNTDFMSFPLCAAGLIVSIEWFIYGTLISDRFLALPNLVGVALGLFQMALFIKFPSTSRTKDSSTSLV